METDSTIIDALIRLEGSTYTHNPADPGGPTKYGITLKTLAKWRAPKVVTTADVEALEEPEARAIYVQRYIIDPGFGKIENRQLRGLLVDACVQHGQGDAVMFLQRALEVKADGVLGAKTLTAVAMTNPAYLYRCTVAERAIYYGKIISQSPSLATFAHGWMQRLAEFIRTPVI